MSRNIRRDSDNDKITFPKGYGETKRRDRYHDGAKHVEPMGALSVLELTFAFRADRSGNPVEREAARVLEALRVVLEKQPTKTLSTLRAASAKLRQATGLRSEHPEPGGKAQPAERIRSWLTKYLKAHPNATNNEIAQVVEQRRGSYRGRAVLGPGPKAPDEAHTAEGRIRIYESATERTRYARRGGLDAELLIINCAKGCGVARPSSLFDGEQKRQKRSALKT